MWGLLWFHCGFLEDNQRGQNAPSRSNWELAATRPEVVCCSLCVFKKNTKQTKKKTKKHHHCAMKLVCHGPLADFLFFFVSILKSSHQDTRHASSQKPQLSSRGVETMFEFTFQRRHQLSAPGCQSFPYSLKLVWVCQVRDSDLLRKSEIKKKRERGKNRQVMQSQLTVGDTCQTKRGCGCQSAASSCPSCAVWPHRCCHCCGSMCRRRADKVRDSDSRSKWAEQIHVFLSVE